MLYTEYYPGSTLNTFVNVICVKVCLKLQRLTSTKGKGKGKKMSLEPKTGSFFPSF